MCRARLLDCEIPVLRPHMRSQVADPQERRAARPADMRPLPRVRQHVPDNGAGMRERPAARVADIRFLP